MGTEAFWVPAAIAALGTGVQAVNTNNANKRSQAAEVQSIDNQQQFHNTANSQVKDLTDQIAKNSPNAMAAKETGDFVNTLRKNSASGNSLSGPTSALSPVAGASSRYNTGVANASNAVQNYGDTNAGEMGAIDAAVRQRQNEGLAQQTLGTNLNVLGARSQSQNFVDQLRAQAAGQTNPWATMSANILKNGANAAATNGWFTGGGGQNGTYVGAGS